MKDQWSARVRNSGWPHRVSARLINVYRFTCIDSDGRLKWEDIVENLVTNDGIDDLIQTYFLGSPAARSTWYAGIKVNDAAFAVGDSLASHAWTEFTGYSGTRKALTLAFGGADSGEVNNVASPAAFAITGSSTIDGGFVTDVTSGTGGLLYGGGQFTGGARAVQSGDVVNLTVELSVASA